MGRIDHAVPHIGRLLLQSGPPREVLASLLQLAPMFASYRTIRYLTGPQIQPEALKEALSASAPAANRTVLECAFILARGRRPRVLLDVLRWVERSARDVAKVRVRSAVPLTAPQRKRLLDMFGLEKGPGKLEEEIDPSLIAGIVVRKGWRQWDYSVAGALERVSRQISGG